MEHFGLSSPEVIRLRASQGGPEDMEPHFNWYISYGPEPLDFEGTPHYPVIGTLHAGSANGWGDVSMGGLLMVIREVDGDSLQESIASSDAVETLYDVARGHLAPLLRTAGVTLEIPRTSPPVEVMEFEEDAEDERAPGAPGTSA